MVCILVCTLNIPPTPDFGKMAIFRVTSHQMHIVWYGVNRGPFYPVFIRGGGYDDACDTPFMQSEWPGASQNGIKYFTSEVHKWQISHFRHFLTQKTTILARYRDFTIFAMWPKISPAKWRCILQVPTRSWKRPLIPYIKQPKIGIPRSGESPKMAKVDHPSQKWKTRTNGPLLRNRESPKINSGAWTHRIEKTGA